jgi:hypothetical protein
MSYPKTSWTAGSTPCSAPNMNNLETQFAYAMTSFNIDLFTSAFVYSGFVASKNGGIPNQLDVTAGVAYIKSSTGELNRVAVGSSTKTTATPSTTYYLILNNVGTWTWGTSGSLPGTSVSVCMVTTDGSGNISTVTDTRYMYTSVLSSAMTLIFPGSISVSGSTATGKLSISGHIVISSGSPPTLSAGANAGGGAPTPTGGASDSDCAGSISFGTGTGPSAGTMANVVFSTVLSSVRRSVIVSPTNRATAALRLYAYSTANGFAAGCDATPAASQPVGTYGLNYIVLD